MKVKKGAYGYLIGFKKRRLLGTLLLVAAMAAVIGFGYWRYHTMKTIFTVMGILFSLPIAKILSGFLVVLPLHSISKERYERMKKEMDQVTEDQILWDLALASAEKVRYFPCVVFSDQKVIVFYEKGTEKVEKEEARKYFRNLLKRNSHKAEILFCTEEDLFLQQVKRENWDSANKEEIERIRETILVYEM